MSNFPPPPPFGGGFYPGQPPFPPHPPPPAGYGMNAQFPYMQQQRQQPYGQGPPLHPPGQFNNPAAFNQNQYHMAQHQFPQPVPQNYYPFQYQGGNTVPQSNGPHIAFSQGPPPGTGYNHIHNNMSIPVSGPSQSNTPNLYQSMPHQEQTQWPHQVVQLSNSGSDAVNLQPFAENGAAAKEAGRQNARSEMPSAGGPDVLTVTAESGSDVRPALSYDGAIEPLENSKPPNVSAIRPTSSGIISLHEVHSGTVLQLPGLGGSDVEASYAGNAAPRSDKPDSAAINKAAWQDRRGEATIALRELVTGGITHERISNEGIDLELLKILVPPQPAVSITKEAEKQGHPDRRLVEQQRASTPESGEASEAEHGSPALTVPASAPITAATQTATLTDLASAPTATAATTGDRKDYIARLLAAKQSVAKPPGTSPTTSADNGSVPVPSEASTSIQSVEATQLKELKKAETKDPVQTELVRKRLEALKSARLNQAKPELRSGTNGQQSEQAASSNETPSRANLSRSYSFYADNEQQVVDGLPGLSPVTLSRPSQINFPLDDPAALSFPSQNPAQAKTVPGDAAAEVGQGQVTNTIQPITAVSKSQRKRPSASDFIDSPPTRKRRLDEGDPIQLVIDVSEDEEGEIIDDLAVHQGAELLNSLERRANAELSALRDKPPLSNAPFESTTPRPSSQAQTPKSLSQLEADIAAEKERIATIMRIKKVARTDSAQGPTSHSVDSGNTTPSKLVEGQNQPERSQQMKQQQRSLAATKQRLKEKLEAERRTHALITARAEQEQRQAAAATSLNERDRRLQRKATLEASLPKIDAEIESAQRRMNEVRNQQERLQADIDREIRDRQAILDEINALMAIDLESETEADNTAPVAEATQIAATFSDDQAKEPTPSPQSSADLPVVRQPSPYVSSHADDAFEDEMDISGSSDDEQENLTENAAAFDSIYGESEDGSAALDGNIKGAKAGSSDEAMDATPDEYDPSIQEGFSDDDEKADNDSAELDEEPRIFPGSPQVVESEDYEATPISEAPFSEQAAQSVNPELPQETEQVESGPAAIQHVPDTGAEEQGNVAQDSSAADLVGSEHPEREISDEEMSRSDYEPPEAPGTVDNISPAAVEPKTVSAGEADDVPASGQETGEAFGQGGPAEEVEESGGHYTPYESPLRRFHSYRYHPQYVNNVSGGFSSLTFSHNLQTDKILCRWELAGGICNDSACEYQHFRELPLTGNQILLELGSVHEGKPPEERKQYVEGLRELLSSLRDRGLNDIETIAANIVAYRSRFLQDPSRVVTHI